jgi:hypothetical protein
MGKQIPADMCLMGTQHFDPGGVFRVPGQVKAALKFSISLHLSHYATNHHC